MRKSSAHDHGNLTWEFTSLKVRECPAVLEWQALDKRSRESRDPLRAAVIRPKRQHISAPGLMSSPTSRQVKLWGYTRCAASSTNVTE